MLSELLLVVSCRECRLEMGQVDEAELKMLIRENERGPICFNCEPYPAMVSPEIYWQASDGDKIMIDDDVFTWEDGLMKPSSRARGDARGERARACLSSSTYLNETNKNRAIFANGEERAFCKKCGGFGSIGTVYGPVKCLDCDGLGWIETAIFLPAWIIGGEVKNA